MPLDPNPDSVPSSKGSPYEVPPGSFLDVLVLFLRTIPLYPDGHGRVVAVTEKFQAALRERGSSTVVEPLEGGLRVDGEEHLALSVGAAAFRDGLLRTGVCRVTFLADAPHASYVVFARSLQRNARLAQSGHLTFADLWMAPIEGIKVEEQAFSRDDFRGDERDEATVIGARGDGDDGDGDGLGGDGVGGGEGDGVGAARGRPGAKPATGRLVGAGRAATPAAASGPAVAVAAEGPVARAAPRPARTLRALVLEDEASRDALARVRDLLTARGDVDYGVAAAGRDVLDHLLASLPIEARLDLRRGVGVVRDVLRRLEASLRGGGASAAPELSGSLLQALQGVFPDRRGELRAVTPPPVPAPTSVASTPPDPAVDDLAVEEAAIDDVEWAIASTQVDLPPAAFDDVDGILDPAGVVTHAMLEVPPGPRLEALRARLAEDLSTRPALAKAPCVLGHLREALAVAPEKRDVPRVRALASAVEASRLDVQRMFGTGLDPDLVVAAFPALGATFVAAGGSAGYLARAVGRSAVLAAGPELLAEEGLLGREELVAKVLGERTRDALPFVELLVPAKEPARRRAVLASLRHSDLPSTAALALRVAPEDRVSEALLLVLCEDGFEGRDSHRADEEAVRLIGDVAAGHVASADTVARAYATSTLSGFHPALAGPVVRELARRRMLFGAPKEVRSAAALVLEKWERGEGKDAVGFARPEDAS